MRLLKLVPDNTNLPFVSLRKWAFGLTLLLSVLALGSVVYKGLNFGVDFEGGLMIEEKFQTAPDLDRVRTVVDGLGLGESALQQVGDPRTLSIRLPNPENADEGAINAVVERVKVALAREFPGATFSRYDTVSGKVSGELTLGFFAITQFEFNLHIVAAVLTIVGYSINDKIVIDDRIRENMRKYRKMGMKEIVDLSVNETLPRTVMTSITILLALGALLILGGHVLRGFTAAMILGIVVGTYSSIYVSSSLLITLGLRANPEADAARGKSGNAARVAP